MGHNIIGPSVRPSVRLSVCPFFHPSVSLSVPSIFLIFLKGMPFKLYNYLGAFVTYCDPILVFLISNCNGISTTVLQGQFAPVKGNYSQELKDLIMLMLSQDPGERPSAHDLMYAHIPKVRLENKSVGQKHTDIVVLSTKPSVFHQVSYFLFNHWHYLLEAKKG